MLSVYICAKPGTSQFDALCEVSSLVAGFGNPMLPCNVSLTRSRLMVPKDLRVKISL